MKKILGAIGIAGGLGFGQGVSEAVDLYVPGSYTTIQEAIDTANPIGYDNG